MAREKNTVPETRGWAELGALLKTKENQKALADAAGVSQSVVSELLNRVKIPSLEVALAFEKLGIEPKAWKEPPPSPNSGPVAGEGDAA